MIGKLIAWGAKKALNKYIIIGAVTLLLGSAALIWHNFKQGLRDEGRQVCVQVINEQTVIDLQNALAAERATATRLTALMVASARETSLARERLRVAGERMDSLEAARKEQERTDEKYAAWSSTPLPGGVADRMRNLRTGSDSDTSNDDSN